MARWPKDNMAAKIAFYGDPRGPNGSYDRKWFAANMIKVRPPFVMYYAKKPVATLTVHKKCADALLAALNDIWDACTHNQATVDKTGASDYAGIFNYRLIAGSHNLSNHSFGCAIDLSPAKNGFNMKSTLPALVVNAFKKQGARWGGDYKGRKDPMHFEFVS